MKKIVLLIAMVVFSDLVQAKPAFTGQNYSGVYACKGTNSEVGDYEVTVTLKLNRVSSYGNFGAYQYDAETVNAMTYAGQAAADGSRLAISLKLTDRQTIERSIGNAIVKKDTRGRWSFLNRYYEADDYGGNYGSEYCVMKSSPVASKTGKKGKVQ